MEWVVYFVLDLIHDITFGERVGFAAEGRDVNDVISGVHQMMAHTLYASNDPSAMRYNVTNNMAVFVCYYPRSIDTEEPAAVVVQ
jgi:hypothetical protein